MAALANGIIIIILIIIKKFNLANAGHRLINIIYYSELTTVARNTFTRIIEAI